jgi:thioredoxin reductase/NAD-dependent dihydropyrimidine dehydrogenase PreA subunit
VITSCVLLGLLSLARAAFRQKAARAALHESRALGLDEPQFLHPRIDPRTCFGCAACIDACPENGALAVVDGQARLVHGARCIGHGQCKPACPVDAIELVLGTPSRPLQIPRHDDTLQSSVPGLYIAGELAGQGLIRLAMEQGLRAVENLAHTLTQHSSPADFDVAIVGAGPAGLAAGLACRERGIRHVILDQEGLGGSVNHYPRQKVVMTSPVRLPLVGEMHFTEVAKEELLAYLQGVVRDAGLEIRAPARVVDIRRGQDGTFDLETSVGSVRARGVVLAVGRRGTPTKLGIPGEDSSKVAYRLIDPDQFRDRDVLVVGGGNSAVEAAIALAEAPARVTLSYRGDAFRRVAAGNLRRLEAMRARLRVETSSSALEIEPERVRLQATHGESWIPNQQVFIFAGGELPTAFLQRVGVELATYTGQPPYATGRQRRTLARAGAIAGRPA